jgi:hypothetical protein
MDRGDVGGSSGMTGRGGSISVILALLRQVPYDIEIRSFEGGLYVQNV